MHFGERGLSRGVRGLCLTEESDYEKTQVVSEEVCECSGVYAHNGSDSRSTCFGDAERLLGPLQLAIGVRYLVFVQVGLLDII